MNSKPIVKFFLISLVLAILSAGISYQLGLNKGLRDGRDFTNTTYLEQPKKEFGSLLTETAYIVSLEGQLKKIEKNILELSKDGETVQVNLSDKVVLVKGPDINKPDQMRAASFSDMKLGDKIWLNAYPIKDKGLLSYQVFIYK